MTTRLFSKTVSDTIRRPFCFLHFSLLAFAIACSHAPVETGRLPAPPVSATPTSVQVSSWTVPAWSGSSAYRLSQHAVVTSDSSGDRSLAFDTTRTEHWSQRRTSGSSSFTIARTPAESADNRISAAFVGDALAFEKSGSAEAPCDPAMNQLRSELSDLALRIPSLVSPGSSWADSTGGAICIGGAPGTARSSRRFEVLGDTAVDLERALIIERNDSTTIVTEGVVNQHLTTTTGTATSSARLYVSEMSGKVLRMRKEQLLRLSVAAEGRTRGFVQRVSSTLELVR